MIRYIGLVVRVTLLCGSLLALAPPSLSQDSEFVDGYVDWLKGYYMVTVSPVYNPSLHVHFDSCQNLEEVSPWASVEYPAGIAGLRYMLCIR